MSKHNPDHWRPSMGFVLAGALGGVLTLGLLGLVALRYLGPEIGFQNAAIVLGAIIVSATAMLGWLVMRLLLRPIYALETFAAAHEQGQGAPPAAPFHFGTRELRATGHRVITMANTLRDREATIRAYTDHVTHEIRTPVSAIRAAAELMEDGGELSPQDQKLLDQITGAARQIDTQLGALRSAAMARETRYLGMCCLNDVVPELDTKLTLTSEGAAHPVPMRADGVEVILSQLLRNAAEHGADAVHLTVTHAPDGAELIVHNNGRGISPGNAQQVFEPFFTTKREAGGTGMGLSVVRAILRAHGGDIRVQPSETGAAFVLRFAAQG